MRFLLPLLILGACTPEDEYTQPLPDDTAPPTPECSDDLQCEAWEICEGEVCVDGDRDDEASGRPTLPWEEARIGYLNPPGDVDTWTFAAEEPGFVRLSTRPTGSGDGEREASEEMDTVLLLYDAAGEVVAWEDDYPTGSSVSGYDSIVYAYLSEPGDYYAVVLDASTAYALEDELGGPDFSYALELQPYSEEPDEPDSFASPGAEREVEEGYLYPVAVLLEETGDSDWIELSLPYGDCPVILRGSANLEGTDATPRVRLYDGGETLLLDLPTLGTDGVALYPAVDGGEAIIEALDADEGGGSNHWFFLFASIYEQGYPITTEGVELHYAVEEEPNDDLDHAMLLDQADVETSGGSAYTATHFWGTQDGPGDEDWFAFHAEAGWFINAWGTAEYNGSLMDPALELYDASGALLTTWYDGSDAAPDLMNHPVESTGTHYLRIVDETGSAEGGAAFFYRFSLYVTSFEAS
jgi:hypothetical protein